MDHSVASHGDCCETSKFWKVFLDFDQIACELSESALFTIKLTVEKSSSDMTNLLPLLMKTTYH